MGFEYVDKIMASPDAPQQVDALLFLMKLSMEKPCKF